MLISAYKVSESWSIIGIVYSYTCHAHWGVVHHIDVLLLVFVQELGHCNVQHIPLPVLFFPFLHGHVFGTIVFSKVINESLLEFIVDICFYINYMMHTCIYIMYVHVIYTWHNRVHKHPFKKKTSNIKHRASRNASRDTNTCIKRIKCINIYCKSVYIYSIHVYYCIIMIKIIHSLKKNVRLW